MHAATYYYIDYLYAFTFLLNYYTEMLYHCIHYIMLQVTDACGPYTLANTLEQPCIHADSSFKAYNKQT